MPQVIGINQVPADIRKLGFWDNFGTLQGKAAGRAFDALLAAMTAGTYQKQGRSPVNPTPQNPGQLQFPSGATTPTSPAELQQIIASGGIPTTGGQRVPLIPEQAPGNIPSTAVQFLPPTRSGMRPTAEDILERQATEAKIQNLLSPQSIFRVNPETGLPEVIGIVPKGSKESKTKDKTASELAREAEFGDLGSQVPDELPDASSLAEGTRAVDDQTGEVWVIKNGEWVKE